MSSISDAGLKEMSKKFLDFKYIALDSSDTAYNTAQTAPQQELTTAGAERKMGDAVHNASTGVVTLSTQFTFTGTASIRAVCFLNAISGGVMLSRYVPASGTLPNQFNDGGSLLVEATCTLSRPA